MATTIAEPAWFILSDSVSPAPDGLERVEHESATMVQATPRLGGAVIGHAKTDGRLGRNYLLGVQGDQINAILSGCGYNLRKLLTVLLFVLFGRRRLNPA